MCQIHIFLGSMWKVKSCSYVKAPVSDKKPLSVEPCSMKSLLFWQSYPHWFPFDKNHMSAQLFYQHSPPPLLCSMNPDYQFPGALCPCLSTRSGDLTGSWGEEKERWKKNSRKTGELTVPLSSPRWLFCWALRLCRGTVRCPLECSGEDRSPKETGSPVWEKERT